MDKQQRLRVYQVWTGWADEIANRVVYGAFGRQKRKVKNKGAHRFLRARGRWNQHVRWLLSNGWITEFRAKQMTGCRYQGVKLSTTPLEHTCHYAFCPYCYYRWLTGFLKTSQSWAKASRLDVIMLVGDVPEDCIFEPRFVRGALLDHRELRSALVERARADGCRGAATSWMWPYVKDPKLEIFGYTQRHIVIGQGLNRQIETPKHVKINTFFDIEAKKAWNALEYCRIWLDLPFDVGQQVIRWNKSFRSIQFEGKPNRLLHKSW